MQQGGQHAYRGGLAGAVRVEHAEHDAFTCGEVGAGEGWVVPNRLVSPVASITFMEPA